MVGRFNLKSLSYLIPKLINLYTFINQLKDHGQHGIIGVHALEPATQIPDSGPCSIVVTCLALALQLKLEIVMVSIRIHVDWIPGRNTLSFGCSSEIGPCVSKSIIILYK